MKRSRSRSRRARFRATSRASDPAGRRGSTRTRSIGSAGARLEPPYEQNVLDLDPAVTDPYMGFRSSGSRIAWETATDEGTSSCEAARELAREAGASGPW